MRPGISLLPALVKARKRPDKAASPPGPAGDLYDCDSPSRAKDDNVFELVPPQKILQAWHEAWPEPEPEAPVKEVAAHQTAAKKAAISMRSRPPT